MSPFNLFKGFFGFSGPQSLNVDDMWPMTPILEPEDKDLISRFPRRASAPFCCPSPNPISRASL
uniref:HCLS1 associated protein X-1 n=1 Tax=Rhinolophus ferrumequinum TaxID=59479 RepID=A0A671FD89_RHIFE